MIHLQPAQQSHFPVNWAIKCLLHDSMYRELLYDYDSGVAFVVALPLYKRTASVLLLLSLLVANEALRVNEKREEIK